MSQLHQRINWQILPDGIYHQQNRIKDTESNRLNQHRDKKKKSSNRVKIHDDRLCVVRSCVFVSPMELRRPFGELEE